MAATFAVVVAGAGGVFASYTWDLPTGPTIVGTLVAVLMLCGAAKQLMRLRAVAAP